MNRHTLVSIALLLSGAASVRAGINAPQVGITRHSDGTVHSLYGLHANFIYGRQMFSLAQAASFSDQAGLLSVRGQIELISPSGVVLATIKANEPSPVLNVDGDVNSAIAWLPSQKALLFKTDSSFDLVAVGDAFSGTVTSLSRRGSSARLFVNAADSSVSQIDIDLNSGNITNLQPIPSASGPVFAQQSFLIFHDDAGLEIMAPDNSIRTLPLAATDLTVERLSSAWLHLHSESLGRDWALHLDSTAVELSELPAPPVSTPSGRRAPPGFSSPVTPIRGIAR